MKKNLITKAVTLFICLGYASSTLTLSPQMPPDFGAFINGVGKAISIASDLQKLGPQFRAFPTKVDAVTTCMNYKSKQFPKWAKGDFSDVTDAMLASKKVTKDQLKQIAQVCLGTIPVKTKAGVDLGKIDCSTSRKCTVTLVNTMEDMIKNIQNTIVSDNGLMGIVFFNLFNTFAKGDEITKMQNTIKEMFEMVQKNVELLDDVKAGIEKATPAKK